MYNQFIEQTYSNHWLMVDITSLTNTESEMSFIYI